MPIVTIYLVVLGPSGAAQQLPSNRAGAGNL